jgi:tetratricopeptide (TPR) repeat protein
VPFNRENDYFSFKPEKKSIALADESIDRLNESDMKIVPDGVDPISLIVKSCYQNDFSKGLAIADQVYVQYNLHPTYWNQIGTCYFLMGHERKALLYYNKALEVSPNYTPTLNNFGVIYRKNKDDQKALAAFERALKGGALAKTPRFNLAQLYLSYGLVDLALPMLKGLEDNTPGDIDVISGLASSYFLLGDYQNAVSYFRRIPQSLFEKPEIGLNFAMTLHYLGEKESARKVFNHVSDEKLGKLKNYYTTIKKRLGE